MVPGALRETAHLGDVPQGLRAVMADSRGTDGVAPRLIKRQHVPPAAAEDYERLHHADLAAAAHVVRVLRGKCVKLANAAVKRRTHRVRQTPRLVEAEALKALADRVAVRPVALP